ncbi:MAG: VWA domain-containing protein, partial [Planctomycetes bacterium]|nr:VWA domain-containing protein [Planctomycetota bacterium]
MEFARPTWLLLAVPALLLVLVARRRSAVGLSPGRLRASTVLRALGVTAVVLAVAGARATLPHKERAVVFALDVSDSVPPAARTHALAWAQQAWAGRTDDDRAALLAFAGEARVEQPLQRAFVAQDPSPDGLVPQRTSLGQALRTAGALLRSEVGERRVVIFSDGNGDREQARREALSLASAGIQVTTVLLERSPAPREVLVRQVYAPQSVARDEPLLIKVELDSGGAGEAEVTLTRDPPGAEPLRQRVALQPGLNRVTFRDVQREAGLVRYTASIDAEGDEETANNVGATLVRVRGQPSVLFVQREGAAGEAARPLLLALEAAGYRVRVMPRPPSGLAELSGYSALIVGDVGAEQWSDEALEATRRWVFEHGGGLLTLGGEHTYGLGGYFQTPLEDALPVRCDVPDKEGLPSVALVLCIDASGSMGTYAGTATRLQLAKEGARRCVGLLQPWDRIGVIGFTTQPTWVAPLTRVSAASALPRQLSAYTDEGGTRIGPALRAAAEALSTVDTPLRHAVLLTDGHAESLLELQPELDALTRAGVTVTTVGVGADADSAFLSGLAAATGGRALVSVDARALPRLMSQEAVVASRALLVERPVRPRWLGPEPEGWADAPPLLGFVLTTARPESELLLDTGPGDGPEDGPLLVRWRYGLGKAVAFTSDASSRWTGPWLSWEGYARLFARQLRWLTQPRGAGFEVSLSLRGGEGVLDVRTQETEAAHELWLRLSTPAEGPPPPPEPLLQVGPGHFQARFDAGLSGSYLATVERRRADGTAERVGWMPGVIAYPDEYRDLSQDAALLEELAQRTGGQALTLDDPPEVYAGERVGRASVQPLDPWLLGLAALLLVCDVAARRLQLPRLGQLGGDFRASDGATLAELRAHKQAARDLADQRLVASVSARSQRPPAAAEQQPAPPAPRAERP